MRSSITWRSKRKKAKCICCVVSINSSPYMWSAVTFTTRYIFRFKLLINVCAAFEAAYAKYVWMLPECCDRKCFPWGIVAQTVPDTTNQQYTYKLLLKRHLNSALSVVTGAASQHLCKLVQDTWVCWCCMRSNSMPETEWMFNHRGSANDTSCKHNLPATGPAIQLTVAILTNCQKNLLK